MNHYPHHIGDFAKKTKGLTLTERGAYRELLDQYYASEKPLPAERREVYRMALAATPAERKAVDYILGKYFVEEADGWHNKRADEEIVLYRKRAETARNNGVLGGRRRTEDGTHPVTGLGTHSEPKDEPGGVPEANQSGKLAVNQNQNTNAVSSELPSKTHPRTHDNGSHRNGSAKQPAGSFADWRVNNDSALRKGRTLGIAPQTGETWDAFRTRIAHVEAERERKAVSAAH